MKTWHILMTSFSKGTPFLIVKQMYSINHSQVIYRLGSDTKNGKISPYTKSGHHFSGFCIKFCSNDGISNPFQSLEIKIKVIDLLDNQSPTIRTVAEVIGLMVTSFPGVMYGPLYYRQLETEKVAAPKQSKGSFDSFTKFSGKARSDLQWWI